MRLSCTTILVAWVWLAVACQSRQTPNVEVEKNPEGTGTNGQTQTGTQNQNTEVGNDTEIQNGVQVTTPQQTTGLSDDAFQRGKIFVGAWDGVTDEIPSGSEWHLKSVQGSSTANGNNSTPPQSGGSAVTVSYESHIKAVLDRACTSCHRPGGSRGNSPMQNYQSARQFADQVVDQAVAGTMPPSGGGLSAGDKELLQKWKSTGYPEKAGSGPSTIPETPPAAGGSGSEIVFRIPKGTGSGPWNTAADPVMLKVGVKFVIVNDDTVTHQWHTDGAPCKHGRPIPAGGREECVPDREFAGPSLYDHISNGKFYVQARK